MRRFITLDDECDCNDRSWYGPQHDSACPLAGQERETAALCAELQAWCAANNLPQHSADDLHAREDITDEQRTWLRGFINRWDQRMD